VNRTEGWSLAPRREAASQAEVIEVGDLKVDLGAHAVTQAGAPVSLTPLEFDLLASLARAAGRVLSRDQLLDEISGRDYEVFDRSIDVHVSALRRKLGDDPRNPRYIRTVRSAGYMLIRLSANAGTGWLTRIAPAATGEDG
jgi:DNA-binding response OmpR family regulator